MARFYVGANIVNRGDGLAGTVGDRLAAGVDAGAIVARGDGFGPGKKVGGLFAEQEAALFLVKEEDGVRGKALGARCGDRGGGVVASEVRGMVALLLGLQNLGVEAAIGEDQEAPSLLPEQSALTVPRVRVLASSR
jgi:hypothetical protein